MKQAISEVLAEKGHDIATIRPDDAVAEAVRHMNERRIGSVLVMDGDRLVGIFTERDVLVRVVGERRDPETTRVSEVMTRRVLTIRPETRIEEAMVLVTRHRCRHLPVLTGDKVVGLVSSGDLTRWLVRDQQNHIDDLERFIMTG